MIRKALPLAFLIASGCTQKVSNLSCSDVADEAIKISNGALIAINSRSQTSKDADRIVCHGTGFYKSGDEVPVRFQAFKSDDGDILVKYDTEEYQAAQEAKERRQEQADSDRFDQQVQQTVDAATQQMRSASMTTD